jgi:hypothetical protein
MWMVNPKFLCTKHLLGCHVEMHMFLGHLSRKRQITKYITHNCLEPLSLKSYHDSVASEMFHRGMNHKTPLTYDLNIFNHLPQDVVQYTVDAYCSIIDLLTRCGKCATNYEKVIVY